MSRRMSRAITEFAVTMDTSKVTCLRLVCWLSTLCRLLAADMNRRLASSLCLGIRRSRRDHRALHPTHGGQRQGPDQPQVLPRGRGEERGLGGSVEASEGEGSWPHTVLHDRVTFPARWVDKNHTRGRMSSGSASLSCSSSHS